MLNTFSDRTPCTFLENYLFQINKKKLSTAVVQMSTVLASSLPSWSSSLSIEYLLQFHLPYPQDSRIFGTHVMSVRQYLGQLKVISYLKIRNTLQNNIKPLKVKFYYWWAFVEVELHLQVTYESRRNWKVLTSDRLFVAFSWGRLSIVVVVMMMMTMMMTTTTMMMVIIINGK